MAVKSLLTRGFQQSVLEFQSGMNNTNYVIVAYQDFDDTVKLVEEIITGSSSEKITAF